MCHRRKHKYYWYSLARKIPLCDSKPMLFASNDQVKWSTTWWVSSLCVGNAVSWWHMHVSISMGVELVSIKLSMSLLSYGETNQPLNMSHKWDRVIEKSNSVWSYCMTDKIHSKLICNKHEGVLCVWLDFNESNFILKHSQSFTKKWITQIFL